MRNHVILLSKFFRLPRREVLSLLTEEERECLEVEAMVANAVFASNTRPISHAVTPRLTTTLFGLGGVSS